MCYVCGSKNNKIVKYHNIEICESCLTIIYESISKVLEVYYQEDDCFQEVI